jgi:hypothetical protein
MKILALILPALLMVLPGCIVTYKGFPQGSVSPSQSSDMDRSTLYHVRTDGFLADLDTPSNKRTMVKAIESQTLFSEEIATDTPPEKGMYCSIYVKWEITQKGGAGAVLLFLIPDTEQVLYSVQYDLWNNQKRLTTGRYEIVKKTWIWLPLLPVFWVNWFNTSKQDAFSATLQQFILDAQRDGFL